MRRQQRIKIWIIVIANLGILAAILASKGRPIAMKGAVITNDVDPRRQAPIGGVEISVEGGLAPRTQKSDSSGYFSVPLFPGVKRGETVTLQFRHPEYEPLDLIESVGKEIYIARMVPRHRNAERITTQPRIPVGNVSVRYTLQTSVAENVGSAVKTFQIVNLGNVPCEPKKPCSPDGKWKAVIGSASLDAGGGNEFRNARLSCIAGPCPFTHVDEDGFSRGGRAIHATVRNWSDTTTFLLEAEVHRAGIRNAVQKSYPVIFGRALTFTLPEAAEGTTLEAELNGELIIFPLAPQLRLSWAECDLRPGLDRSKVYRCELKPEYLFR
jgi:hypothetical protein